jgi:dipeptidyl aminopeptidase/acylaminoacyl peptidase
MRVWPLTLPGLAVVLAGCGRSAPAARGAQPRAQGLRTAHIVFAQPSPTGDALAVGTLSRGQPIVTGQNRGVVRLDALWLVDLRTGTRRRLPTDPLPEPSVSRLLWRPDGGALAWATPAGRIEVYDLAAGASRVVSPHDMYCSGPAWSPDGKRLVFLATTAFYQRPKPGGPNAGDSQGPPPAEAYRRPVTAIDAHDRAIWEFDAGAMRVYSMPADGSARPRLEGDAPGRERWHWNVALARLLPSSADQGDPARRRALRRVSSAHSLALSPDGASLAYSAWDVPGGAAAVVLDRSLAPIVQRRGLEAPLDRLVWSPDSTKLLASNEAGQLYLLDRAAKEVSVVDDPVLSAKKPVGWIQWKGKWQLALIDEGWTRVVMTEKIGAPIYTLMTLNEDGSPVLALPVLKEN